MTDTARQVAYQRRRRQSGERRVSVWLDAELVDWLDRAAPLVADGSRAGLIRLALTTVREGGRPETGPATRAKRPQDARKRV